MKNTISSTSTILFCGLSSLASSSVSINEMKLQTEEELYAVELTYNAPENFKSNSDIYIANTYKAVFEETKYTDSNLLELTQKIAEEQIILDNDFLNALDELFFLNINSKPTKSRF